LLGSTRSSANGVSPDGNIVVGLSGGFGDRATVWDTASGGMYDLQELLTDRGFDLTGWSLRSANAVSGDPVAGYNIVGWGFDPQGPPEAFLVTGLQFPPATPVPEPPTFVLVVLGAISLGAAACRHRQLLRIT
jgi:hypothetical protein